MHLSSVSVLCLSWTVPVNASIDNVVFRDQLLCLAYCVQGSFMFRNESVLHFSAFLNSAQFYAFTPHLLIQWTHGLFSLPAIMYDTVTNIGVQVSL